MTDHDQKCAAYGFGPGQRMDICICTGIRIGRADAEDFFATVSVPNIEAEIHNRLRAKVLGLRDRGLGTVLRADVLALFPEEKS